MILPPSPILPQSGLPSAAWPRAAGACVKCRCRARSDMFPGTRDLWGRLRHYFVPIRELVDGALARAEDSE